MRQFFRHNLTVILMTVFSLIIFAILFALFSLPWGYYWVATGLILVVLSIILLISLSRISRERSLEEVLSDTQARLREEIFNSKQREGNLRDYFMLWIHQIKTPITASYLLLDRLDNSAPLRQEMVRIENYTQLALNYLKVSQPGTDLALDWVALDELIAPLLKKYRYQFINEGLQLVYNPIETQVLTDANLSQVMIEQVLSNALKYTPQGKIEIYFQEGSLLIRDTGIGIRAEDLPRVFEQGYSGLNGQLNEKSSGIGLYMAKLIAKRLHQPVSLDSKLDEGTVVTIEFNCQG